MAALSKTERGRLKKLSKRARSWDDAVGNANLLSGIATAADWHELEQLHQRDEGADGASLECSVQVHMRLKAGGDKQNCTVGVASHRALLVRFLTTLNSASVPNSSNPKRKRQGAESADSSLYSWACLHNPAAVSNVVVWDLVVESSEAAVALQARLVTLAQRVSRSVVTVPTHWFERNQHIKSAADGLFYEPPPSPTRQRNRKTATSLPTTLESLSALLEPLVVSHEILQSECYPLAPTREDLAAIPLEYERGANAPHLQPSDVTLDAACTFIADFQATNVTNASNPRQDSNLANFDLLPYVVSTQSNSSVERRRVFALDCEMVETHHGLELARITLCQLEAVSTEDTEIKIMTSVVFDSLIRPRNTVLNYLTQYSGVTAALLNPEATTVSSTTESLNVVRLEQVQAALLRTIHPRDILIGHSLENDLHACRFIHTTVIDTALLFQRTQNRQDTSSTSSAHATRPNAHKFALRHLAAVLLRKQIQAPDQPHCSEEDAVTALELAVHRALQGPSFGMADASKPTNVLIQHTKDLTAVAVGPLDWLQRHVLSTSSLSSVGSAVHALQCASVHESNSNAMSSWLTGPKRRAHVVCAQFDLSKSTTVASRQGVDDGDRFESIAEQLWSKLSSRAVVVVAIQCGLERAKELTQNRRLRQNRRATIPWSDAEEEEWKRAVEACRTGSVLWIGGASSKTS